MGRIILAISHELDDGTRRCIGFRQLRSGGKTMEISTFNAQGGLVEQHVTDFTDSEFNDLFETVRRVNQC